MYVTLREILGPCETGGKHDRYFEETRLEGVRSSRDIFEDSYYDPDSEPLYSSYGVHTLDQDYMYFFGDDEIAYNSKILN